ncbi:MAG: serpin family protein [Candidatus Obscuribacterales bacterium]|jgi:serine protease inhibitor
MQTTLLPSDKDYWKHIVTSNNQFGLNVLKTLAMASPSSNVMISPTSIFLTACMLYNGAGGNTYSEFANALQLPKPSEINPWNRQLLNYLVMSKPDHEVSIASALWFGQGVRCHEDFVNNAVESYSASLYGVDFNSPEAVEQINFWAENATNGKITKIVDSSDFTPLSAFAITNAIYFFAQWQTKFKAELTREEPFYLVGSGSKNVMMMNTNDSFVYKEDDNAQIIKLPYKQSPYYMQIVLPKLGRSFGHCIEYIKNPNIAMAGAVASKVDLKLPRMEIAFDCSLNSVFAQLGMRDLFGQSCDLSLITPGLLVSFIKHAAKLSVDESGTEVAATTIAGMSWGAAPGSQAPPIAMTVNRPFLMAIADSGTGQVLFSGAILAP